MLRHPAGRIRLFPSSTNSLVPALPVLDPLAEPRDLDASPVG